MGVGIGIVLIALGAILIWAVEASVAGIDLTAIGWILLVVGIVGTLLSLTIWSSWGRRREPAERERVVVDR